MRLRNGGIETEDNYSLNKLVMALQWQRLGQSAYMFAYLFTVYLKILSEVQAM
jgi:hypothetical protein